MANKEEIIKCKFAGDPEDEYCSQCDGLYPVDDNGKAQPATACGGYEPQEQKQQQQASVNADEACEICGETQEQPACNNLHIKGLTSVIRAESGISCEVNGRWFKFMFSEERILPEGCNIELEKQALWESVNAQVDAQVEAVKN